METKIKIADYLTGKKWVKKYEPKENRVYYEKECLGGENKSSNEQDIFKQLGKKRKLNLERLVDEFRSFFVKAGYSSTDCLNVQDSNQDTLFIGAGVQAFYKKLIAGEVSMGTKYILDQPCIRIKAVEKLEKKDGYSTSFVNLCTQEANKDLDEHIVNLEKWFTFLSNMGLYTGHMKLIEDSNWKGGDSMKGESLLVYYGGLQIGDAVFISAKNKRNSEQFNLSDIGFGLERINWAINKSPSYYESIGPISECLIKNALSLDMIRTLTLMGMSGLDSSNNNAGYRFKQFSKKYVANCTDINPNYAIEHYFGFWSKFLSKPLSLEETKKKVVKEIHNETIAHLTEALQLNLHSNDFSNFEDFVKECSFNYPIALPKIANYLNGSKLKVIP